MANTDIASTLISFLAKNPQLVTQFLEHPYSTVQQATGSDAQLSKSDMSQVVTAAAALSTGQSTDFSNLANVAAALLGQNGGSIHALTSALFGTAAQAQTAQTTQAAASTASAGIDLGTLVSLAGSLMGSSASAAATTTTTAKKAATTSAAGKIDLSDGIGIDDILGIASLLGGK